MEEKEFRLRALCLAAARQSRLTGVSVLVILKSLRKGPIDGSFDVLGGNFPKDVTEFAVKAAGDPSYLILPEKDFPAWLGSQAYSDEERRVLAGFSREPLIAVHKKGDKYYAV